MKNSHLLIAGVMCYVLIFNAQAQLSPPAQKLLPEKPSLFGSLPKQFNITNVWIENLFAGPDTGWVNIPLPDNNFFQGRIMEKVQLNPHVVSINVKSSNYDGALLSISKITYDDLTVKYTGRIISIKYGDLFILTQENNTFLFTKKKLSTVITE